MTKIVFFGTPEFAVPALRKLHADGWEIIGVVTAPDKKVGRKQVLTPSPVKSAALALDIPIHDKYDDLTFDLGIVAAYGKLIPQRVLDVPRLGFLNIHPSLLPLYRGASPIQSAILDGKTETGVTIMQLDAEMDHGPIIAQKIWTIPPGFDAQACEEELAELGADLLARILPDYVDGKIEPVPQDHTAATFTKKFTREDGKINWSQPAEKINNRIRALSAEPGTWTVVNGKTLNILSAHITDNKIVPDLVQLEGGKPMDWATFLRGHPDCNFDR